MNTELWPIAPRDLQPGERPPYASECRCLKATAKWGQIAIVSYFLWLQGVLLISLWISAPLPSPWDRATPPFPSPRAVPQPPAADTLLAFRHDQKNPEPKKNLQIFNFLLYYLTILYPFPTAQPGQKLPPEPVPSLFECSSPAPWEREALSGHGGCYKSGGGGFFVLFCSFKISSQNQRFPNDCINSKQTNKPKTKGVFSTKPTCEAGRSLGGTSRGLAGRGLRRWVEELKAWVQDWLLCWVL